MDEELGVMAAKGTISLGNRYSRIARRDDSKKCWVLQRVVHHVRMFSVHVTIEESELSFSDSLEEIALRGRVAAWVKKGVEGRE